MSRSISLFSGYEQRENRTTNYCLLVLKMLYEENPKYLSEVLSTLVGEEVGGQVGVRFQQQRKQEESVPDGLILQSPLSIYIETKHSDWFYIEQLKTHLESLSQKTGDVKVLIALSTFDDLMENRFEEVDRIITEQHNNSIDFAAVSFADFLAAVDLPTLPKNLQDTIADFRQYLSEQKLLVTWRNWLDVVNCAGSFKYVLSDGFYDCPTRGGNYNHGRCQYLGVYHKRAVQYVALIRGVVDIEDTETATVKWINDDTTESEIKREAIRRYEAVLPGAYPKRVFVLGDLYKTNFIKPTRGGMMGSKQYFEVSSYGATNAEELARALDGDEWPSR